VPYVFEGIDRIRDTSTSTGTGALTLDESPPTRFRAFGDLLSDGDLTTVMIEHDSLDEWELAVVTYAASGPTITRTITLLSSNNDDPVNFTAGTKHVYIVMDSIGHGYYDWVNDEFYYLGVLVGQDDIVTSGGQFWVVPPSDEAWPVITVDVTGQPTLSWDETRNRWASTHSFEAPAFIALDGGGGFPVMGFDNRSGGSGIKGQFSFMKNGVEQGSFGFDPDDDGTKKYFFYNTTSGVVFTVDTSGNFDTLGNHTKGGVQWGAGRHEIPIMAGGMVPCVTNGAAAGVVDSGSSDLTFRTFDFDQTTAESVEFQIPMPKGWNEGTVTFIPYWTASAGSGGVVWTLQGVAISNDDPLNGTLGTGQTSTDTLIATGDLHIGPECSAITIGGTPAENDLVMFRLTRTTGDGSDTLTADARLIGIKLVITTNAVTDA